MTTTRDGSVRVTNAGGKPADVAWDDWTEGYSGEEPPASEGIDGKKYSQRTMGTLSRVDEARVNFELIEDVIGHIDASEASCCCGQPPGAILVFLPGMGEIQGTSDQLRMKRGLKHKLHIVPLHSTLSHSAQQAAFDPAPAGSRKLIQIGRASCRERG